jgi:hypothetical protein
MSIHIPWNLFARISVGLPVVGTGEKKALCISSISPAGCKARLRTLPALELRRLLLLLLNEAFFFNVPPLEGKAISPPIEAAPCDTAELDRWMPGPSMIELPLCDASHSSLNRPPYAGCAADCANSVESVGAAGVVPKSAALVAERCDAFGVLPAPYPRVWYFSGTAVVPLMADILV